MPKSVPSDHSSICVSSVFTYMGLEKLALCSMFGWDHVTQGLVQLGFSLLDGFGPKPGPFGKTAEGCGTVARTPAQQACKLGRQVLLQSFKVILLLNSSATKSIINSTLTTGCVFLP